MRRQILLKTLLADINLLREIRICAFRCVSEFFSCKKEEMKDGVRTLENKIIFHTFFFVKGCPFYNDLPL